MINDQNPIENGFFKVVDRIDLNQLGGVALKTIFFDKTATLAVISKFEDAQSEIVHDFLTSGVVQADDNVQTLVDKINKDTPVIVIKELCFPMKVFINQILSRTKRSYRLVPKYNWVNPYRDCVAIRVIKELTNYLNDLRENSPDIDIDIKLNVAVLNRNEFTFEHLRRSKKSYETVQQPIYETTNEGKYNDQ